MRTIAEIAQEIAENNKIVAQEIERIPVNNRPAVRISIIQASEKLPKLLLEMRESVIPSKLIGLFADGDEDSVNRVKDLLLKNEGVVLDAAQLYRTIADLVEPSYSVDRNFCTTQYGLMIQKISEIAINLGYQEIMPPRFIECICPDSQATLVHIRKILRECKVGDVANVDLLTNSIVDAIVRDEIDSKQIPVIVVGTSCQEEKNAISVLFSRTIDYTFPKDFIPTIQNITSLFKPQKQRDLNEEEKQ